MLIIPRPVPCLQGKAHVQFDHLFDTLTTTFPVLSLHGLEWKNTACRRKHQKVMDIVCGVCPKDYKPRDLMRYWYKISSRKDEKCAT